MPDFEFHPWEHFSPAVSEGPSHARLQWDDGEWLFRQCGPLWFARQSAIPGPEHNFVLLARQIAVTTGGQWHCDQPSLDTLHKYQEEFWDQEAMGRAWKLDNWLVGWNARGSRLFAGFEDFSLHQSGTPFQLDSVVWWTRDSSSQVYAALQHDWAHLHSDLRFSAHFASLAPEEQALYGTETRLETPQRFVHLLRCALYSFDALWQNNETSIQIDLYAHGLQNHLSLRQDYFPIRQRAIINHIIRTFEPHHRIDRNALPTALTALTTDGRTRLFSVTAMRPSQHDKLESMLELRAWLEEHWPDGVRHLGKVV